MTNNRDLCTGRVQFSEQHIKTSSPEDENDSQPTAHLSDDFILSMCSDGKSHSRPQRPRSFWSAPRIVILGADQKL